MLSYCFIVALSVGPIKQRRQETRAMNFCIVIVAIVAALLAGLSLHQKSSYSDKMDFEFKSYGDVNKPTIVLVPGLDGATAFFADTVPELTPHFHVVVFYLPLFTNDMKPEEYTFTYLADRLHTVMQNQLRIDHFSLVGESFGGVVSMSYAVQYPTEVDNLVLLSSLAKTELPPEVQWKLDYLMPIVRRIGSFFPSQAQFLFAQVHVEDVVEPHEVPYVRNLFIKEASFAHFFSVVQRINIVSVLDIEEQVKTITCNTLVVYGADDHFTKPASFRLNELISGSSLASLPGGHLPHVTSPKEFSNLITDFCAAVDSVASAA